MKELQEIKDYLCDEGYEEAIVFDNPSFCEAFVGISTDGRAVYDFNGMVESMMEEDGLTWEEAVEFIEYNTIRAMPYFGDMAPIVFYPTRD